VDAETGEVQTITAVHPVAELFPMLDNTDLASLADDIAANGLHSPVTIDPDGVLLDGRNRIAAAKRAKVQVECVTYTGDPVPFILGSNMARRDMTKGQKAMIAAQAGVLSQNTMRSVEQTTGLDKSRLAYASTVLTYAPDLTDSVVAGKRSLDDAYKVAKANKAAAQKSEALLAELEEHAEDLAEKVANGDLELAEAYHLWQRRQKEAEQAAKDRTRNFSDSICQLGAVLDFDDPAAMADLLVTEWRPDSVRMEDVKGWLTVDGLHRIAKCIELVADRWGPSSG
jgi:hypothetical protein